MKCYDRRRSPASTASRWSGSHPPAAGGRLYSQASDERHRRREQDGSVCDSAALHELHVRLIYVAAPSGTAGRPAEERRPWEPGGSGSVVTRPPVAGPYCPFIVSWSCSSSRTSASNFSTASRKSSLDGS